jgi:hypothetical protein
MTLCPQFDQKQCICKSCVIFLANILTEDKPQIPRVILTLRYLAYSYHKNMPFFTPNHLLGVFGYTWIWDYFFLGSNYYLLRLPSPPHTTFPHLGRLICQPDDVISPEPCTSNTGSYFMIGIQHFAHLSDIDHRAWKHWNLAIQSTGLSWLQTSISYWQEKRQAFDCFIKNWWMKTRLRAPAFVQYNSGVEGVAFEALFI